jgi:hypothetical protein
MTAANSATAPTDESIFNRIDMAELTFPRDGSEPE